MTAKDSNKRNLSAADQKPRRMTVVLNDDIYGWIQEEAGKRAQKEAAYVRQVLAEARLRSMSPAR